MIKNQIDVIVFVADRNTELPGLKAKASAEFEEKFLQMVEQGFFQITLGEFREFSEAGEFEDVRITDEILDGFLRLLPVSAADDSLLVFRQPGALVKQRAKRNHPGSHP